MHMTNFVSKIDKKILKGVNFTNLKTSGGYIAKSKPQGACLQLSQTLRGDYAFYPNIFLNCLVDNFFFFFNFHRNTLLLSLYYLSFIT